MPGGDSGPSADADGRKDEGDRARDAATAQPGGVGGFSYGSAGGGTGGGGRAGIPSSDWGAGKDPTQKGALQSMFDMVTSRVVNAANRMTTRPDARSLVNNGYAGAANMPDKGIDMDKAMRDLETQGAREKERSEMLDSRAGEDSARVRASVTAARREDESDPEDTLGGTSLNRTGYTTGNRRTGLFAFLGG
jgi:hypothetical protein